MAASEQVIDANALLQAKKSKLRTTEVSLNGSQPANFDLALLAVFDPNPLLVEDYALDKEGTLESTSRKGVQLLINQIFQQPTKVSHEGVFASLPVIPSTVLPREKSLPKAKPETKWQKFAKSKGIAPKPKRDRLIYDEEKQDFVPRWGYKGKNKEVEGQWIHEVPAGKDSTFDPVKEAKQARKERKLKNKSQQLKNEQRATEAALAAAKSSKPARTSIPAGLAALESTTSSAAPQVKPLPQSAKKADLERLLKSTRTATASLGRFDKVLDKEERVIGKPGAMRGTKRKFEDNLRSAESERQRGLDILQHLDKVPDQKRVKQKKENGLVNARKAIRHASGGKGAEALLGEKKRATAKAKTGVSKTGGRRK